MGSLDSVHIMFLQAYMAAKPLKPPSPQTTIFLAGLFQTLSHLFLVFVSGGG